MKMFNIIRIILVEISLITALCGCGSQGNEREEIGVTSTSQREAEEVSVTEAEMTTEAMLDPSVTEATEEDTQVSDVTEVTEPVQWIQFINEDKNFRLMYPSNWIVVDKDRYGVLLRPTDDTQTSFYVDVKTTIYADYTYDDFVDEMMGDVMRIRSECTFTEPETIQINDYPFVVMDYNDGGAYGLTYYARAFFTANDLGYEMYYVADEVETEIYGPIMEEIALSFEFIQ